MNPDSDDKSAVGTPPASGPLRGVRVVDITTSFAGPTASMYLGDLGADVIKVERPGGGDDCRSWGPPFVDGLSAWFTAANRNKRSIVLDLRSERGGEVLSRLLDTADVFLESLNPAKLIKLGLTPEHVCTRSPQLIYCAVSGFGLSGPDRNLPGYDLIAQARSGMMSVTGAKGGSPQRVSTALSDIVTGLSAALAISAALVRQRTGGQGEIIDVSLLDSDLALMAPRLAAFLAGDPEPAPSGGTDSVLAIYQSFPTADRSIVVAVGNDSLWQRFCEATGLTELAADERFTDNARRRQHRDLLVERITARLAGESAEHWLAALRRAGVPCSKVHTLSEVVSDQQVLARSSLLPAGEDQQLFSVHSPFRLASVRHPRNDPVPRLGEHTTEVLTQLGYPPHEVDTIISETNGLRVTQ
ncbi:CaiB/BaiF CoA transferase family protein [Mycolicibacterium sp. XJ1819]